MTRQDYSPPRGNYRTFGAEPSAHRPTGPPRGRTTPHANTSISSPFGGPPSGRGASYAGGRLATRSARSGISHGNIDDYQEYDDYAPAAYDPAGLSSPDDEMRAYRREYERATRGYNGQFSAVTPVEVEPYPHGAPLQPGRLVKRIIHKIEEAPPSSPIGDADRPRRGRSAGRKNRPPVESTAPAVHRYHRNDYKRPGSAVMGVKSGGGGPRDKQRQRRRRPKSAAPGYGRGTREEIIYEYGSVGPDGDWHPAVYDGSKDFAQPIGLEEFEDSSSQHDPAYVDDTGHYREGDIPTDDVTEQDIATLELVELYRSANQELKRRIQESGADRVGALEAEIKKKDGLIARLKDELRLEARRVDGDPPFGAGSSAAAAGHLANGDALNSSIASASAAVDPMAPGSLEEVKALRDRLARSKKRLDENKEVIRALQEQVSSLQRSGRESARASQHQQREHPGQSQPPQMSTATTNPTPDHSGGAQGGNRDPERQVQALQRSLASHQAKHDRVVKSHEAELGRVRAELELCKEKLAEKDRQIRALEVQAKEATRAGREAEERGKRAEKEAKRAEREAQGVMQAARQAARGQHDQPQQYQQQQQQQQQHRPVSRQVNRQSNTMAAAANVYKASGSAEPRKRPTSASAASVKRNAAAARPKTADRIRKRPTSATNAPAPTATTTGSNIRGKRAPSAARKTAAAAADDSDYGNEAIEAYTAAYAVQKDTATDDRDTPGAAGRKSLHSKSPSPSPAKKKVFNRNSAANDGRNGGGNGGGRNGTVSPAPVLKPSASHADAPLDGDAEDEGSLLRQESLSNAPVQSQAGKRVESRDPEEDDLRYEDIKAVHPSLAQNRHDDFPAASVDDEDVRGRTSGGTNSFRKAPAYSAAASQHQASPSPYGGRKHAPMLTNEEDEMEMGTDGIDEELLKEEAF